ncbi:hypothetical protein D4T97_014210 [Siminovitchia acidinfaciens]|uniref:YxiS n=1 Tax=Siminovitchia acidinfaciens TaxID=2321395 RepID=A0A429XX36_9BACI|nr:hypothetical protein [Siminovitchia acidinfaciens]RST73036.1 hypothetical protein D4T97_014210 [Siminovitchia acidinfaciens]
MSSNELEKKIIDSYRKDEKMMILIFAQWCINHDLNPETLYRKAYPNQNKNQSLTEAMELTVPKEEAGDIPTDTLLGVLSLFGNEDLAFIVTEEMQKISGNK